MARAKNKRRTDGRFVSNITHEGKRYYVYGASLKECDERREELRRSLEQGLLMDGASVTLNAYYEEWTARRKRHVKPSTLYAHEIRYSRMRDSIGLKKLKDITRRDVYHLQDALADRLTASGVNQTIALLKQLLKSAVSDRIIPYNPADDVRPLKADRRRGEGERHRYLTDEELTAFFEAAKGTHYYNFYAFLLLTGMRCGEAAALTWEDVDTKAGIIHIRHTVTRINNNDFVIGSTKTADSVRDIVITDEVAQVLDAQRMRQTELFGLRAAAKTQQVFTTIKGNLVTPTNIIPCIAAACNKAKERGADLERFSAHAFRHTFITHELENGVPMNDIARQVGHSNTITLQKYYSHADTERVKEAFTMTSRNMGRYIKIG